MSHRNIDTPVEQSGLRFINAIAYGFFAQCGYDGVLQRIGAIDCTDSNFPYGTIGSAYVYVPKYHVALYIIEREYDTFVGMPHKRFEDDMTWGIRVTIDGHTVSVEGGEIIDRLAKKLDRRPQWCTL